MRILDENDNSPRFEKTEYQLKIKENSPLNSKFKLPYVTDSDSSPLNVQSFVLEQDQNVFAVENKIIDGEMQAELKLVGELDYENMRTYKLNVIAKDGGKPAKVSTLSVQVEVEDVNDNAPRFNSSKFTVSVSEDLQRDQLVTNIKAFDADGPVNNVLSYSLDDNNHFAVDSHSGNIYLAREVDAETKQLYVLRLTASDSGQPALTNHTAVEVTVTNVNDNNPIIHVDYSSWNYVSAIFCFKTFF